MATVDLLRGDCVEMMASLPEGSVDAVLTDPPYHLTSIVRRFGKPGAAPAQQGTDGAFVRGSRGFMGKEWDGGDIAFRPETWAAALRVLKPGGYLAAFNHSRTWHHLALAIEGAGFEMRDTLMWLYASGFPKSHNVAKAMARARDDSAEAATFAAQLLGLASAATPPITRKMVDAALGTSDMGGWYLSDLPHRCAVPTPDHWAILRDLIPGAAALDADQARLAERKGRYSDAWEAAPVIRQHDRPGAMAGFAEKYGDRKATSGDERQIQDSDVAAWEGWGTALKPAFEPIVLARKPLAEKSVARQCLTTGTGALNIDAARHGVRWPANVLHDGSPDVRVCFPVDLEGSVSRFFFCAKAGAADRAGSAHPTVKPQALMRWLVRLTTRPGAVILDPFAGSGSTGWAAHAEGRAARLIERDPDYGDHIAARIAELTTPPQGADAPEGPAQLSMFEVKP